MKTDSENHSGSLPRSAAIAVVGAGIVGVCCAAELLARGYRVALFDRGEPGHEGASRANAGQVIPSLIHPVAYPGIWRDAPRLLFDPGGPLSIPPAYFPRLVPWLCRFLWASRRSRHSAGMAALAELNRDALEATRDLYRRAGLLPLLKTTGALYLYESDASLRAARSEWRVKGEQGYSHDFVAAEELRRMEPDLSAPAFTGAVFEQGVSHVSDPLKIVAGLYSHALEQGACFHRGEVRIAARSPDGISLKLNGENEPLRYDGLVIAAGAWSRRLLADIGDDAPLEAERGYNITVKHPGVEVRHCLVFADRGFVATPLAPGLRIGGGVELAGLDAPANPRRLDSIVAVAQRLMPHLDVTGGETWMGPRPALPDSVPIIRQSPVDPRIVYAFGHGHLGLTQGPVTGRRVAGMFEEFRQRRGQDRR